MIHGKTLTEWENEYPLLSDMRALREVFWINPGKEPAADAVASCELGMADILDAEKRLERFAPYIRTAFPETAAAGGIIESPLRAIPRMREAQGGTGTWLLKLDSMLPVSGSIKARGGIYEVLKCAEDIAMAEGGLKVTDDYSVLAEQKYRDLFSRYEIAVGSTGNLGLSIGIMSAKLGFRVTVHMSADARQWKKDMLRSKGVTVVEYQDDYSKAVASGREQAAGDPSCHFVDDENSRSLFLGYSAAALRLKEQLRQMDLLPSEERPLFVYLPCGVGGGPGGVAFGIKQVFGDAAHCFFAEPTHAPCMLLGMSTGCHNELAVQDFGIDNRTAADGLAVGRPSGFVGKLIEPFLSGIFTVTDEHMYALLAQLTDEEGVRLEPSALAGMPGPGWLASPAAETYRRREDLDRRMDRAVHIVWATGGSMVPEDVMESYYRLGRRYWKP